MEEDYLKKIASIIVLSCLVLVAFFMLKPILLSIIFAFILAFIFSPIFNFLYKKTKMKNLSAALICVFLILIILLPLWFLAPLLIEQSIKIYVSAQQLDFVALLKSIFPSVSADFSAEIGSMIHSFVIKSLSSLMNSSSQLVLQLPTILLQFAIVFFTFFFSIRDKDELLVYIRSILPFSKDVEASLFKSTEEITSSVLYGQIVLGVIQGLIIGLAFFMFRIPSALILTLVAIFAGILPIIGPALVWVPVVIYLFVAGNSVSAFGISIFGIISSSSESLLRPLLLSKKSRLNPAIAIIGMIGGFFLFGILGFILGPLILAYLIIFLEVYRTKKIPPILIKEEKK
jgi:predicted PurR-regulated permease PerM